MTGKCIDFVQAHLEEFWRERKDHPVLRRIDVEDYVDSKGVSWEQIKVLTLKGREGLYRHRIFRIKVIFYD